MQPISCLDFTIPPEEPCVHFAAATSTSGASITAYSVRAPRVYSVPEVTAALLRQPARWDGRTVPVRGSLMHIAQAGAWSGDLLLDAEPGDMQHFALAQKTTAGPSLLVDRRTVLPMLVMRGTPRVAHDSWSDTVTHH